MDDENGAIEGGMIFGGSFPPDLKEKLNDLMGKLIHKMCHTKNLCEAGTCECQQVAKLTGEALLTFKTNRANQAKLKRQGDLLVAKLELIKTQIDMHRAQQWEDIYEATGLQSTGDYHWCEDGRIMKQKEGGSSC